MIKRWILRERIEMADLWCKDLSIRTYVHAYMILDTASEDSLRQKLDSLWLTQDK